jgi:hypothetical protein
VPLPVSSVSHQTPSLRPTGSPRAASSPRGWGSGCARVHGAGVALPPVRAYRACAQASSAQSRDAFSCAINKSSRGEHFARRGESDPVFAAARSECDGEESERAEQGREERITPLFSIVSLCARGILLLEVSEQAAVGEDSAGEPSRHAERELCSFHELE